MIIDAKYKSSFYSIVSLIILIVIGSSFSNLRVWGFNHFGYWFNFSEYLLGLIALIIAYTIYKYFPDKFDSLNSNSTRNYILISVLSISVLSILFYYFRGTTHFLGDGTQLIPILESESTAIKANNFGEQWLHIQLFKLLPGNPYERGLASYQYLSILFGIFSVIATFVSSYFLFDTNLKRILFSFGIISGGYALMFFGYVENYTIFLFLIMLYSLLGVIGFQNKYLKFLLIPIVVLATWMHVFGILLIPSLIYLFIYNKNIYKKYLWGNKTVKYILIIVIAASSIYAAYMLTKVNLVFKLSILPLIDDKFTVSDYTLFSLDHIIDIINLIIMTIPSLIVVLYCLIKIETKNKIIAPTTTFLLLTSSSLFIATFVFEPKLSMPIDWDIFSVFVVPLTVLIYFITIENLKTYSIRTVLFMILAGFIFITPRVLTQVNENIAITHALNYFELDVKRNGKTLRAVNDYVKKNKLSGKYGYLLANFDTYYPEVRYNKIGLDHKNSGDCNKALSFYYKAINSHRRFSPAYYNIASCYDILGNQDSSKYYAEIAYALNPTNVMFLILLSSIAIKEKQYEKALDYCQKAIAIDKSEVIPYMTLAGIYSLLKNEELLNETLQIVSKHEKATAEALILIGDYYYMKKNINKAKESYEKALQRASDSTQVEHIKKRLSNL